jgi:uncharacterized metal-binding protein YceD (DUF177 family)
MRSNTTIKVPFEGLKLGKHEFDYQITDTFFEKLEGALIEKGNLSVHLTLDKRETMMVADFVISGVVEQPCARCNEAVDVDVYTENQIIFKFTTSESEDENLISVFPHEYELHLDAVCNELIVVSLPSRVVHPEGECNEEMMELLNAYTGGYENDDDSDDDDDDIDPRWDILKKLN